jgi:hypothetical protein
VVQQVTGMPMPSYLTKDEARWIDDRLKGMIHPSEDERKMYLPVDGQYGLPFAEIEFKEEDDYSVIRTWDKYVRPPVKNCKDTETGRNYAVRLQYESRADIVEWLKRIRGRYARYDGGSVIVFERECDYIFAKISFEDGEFLDD